MATILQSSSWAVIQTSSSPSTGSTSTRPQECDTDGRFHVLNLVAGERAEIVTDHGDVHPLAYAETIVVPADVGRYRIRRVERACLQGREGVRHVSRVIAVDLRRTHVSAGRVDLEQARVEDLGAARAAGGHGS